MSIGVQTDSECVEKSTTYIGRCCGICIAYVTAKPQSLLYVINASRMDDLRKQKNLRTGIFVAGGAVLLLLASITILSAALQKWPFTTASNYTFDASKIEINDFPPKTLTIREQFD